MRILLLLLCLAAAPAWALDRAAVEKLTSDDNDVKLEGIQALVAEGDPAAIQVLQRLAQGEVEIDGKVVEVVANNRIRAAVGDALAGLLQKAGFAVTKEYYINDAGGQVDTLARSSFLRYREALGLGAAEIPPGFYPGEYLKDVGRALAARWHGADSPLPLAARLMGDTADLAALAELEATELAALAALYVFEHG